MAVRPCLTCGALQNNGSRCQRCTSQRYGRPHRAARAAAVPIVHLGAVDCARCGQPIGATEPWHLDHQDHGTGYLGPSHVRCNVNDNPREPR